MAVRTKPEPSRSERRLSWALLGVMALITTGVFMASFRQDPFLTGKAGTAGPGEPMPPKAVSNFSFPDWAQTLAKDLTTAGPMETFDAQTLADKIDGKAELYLEAGFTSLRTQRVALKEDPSLWAEFFLFSMNHSESAYAVFSQQRRSSAVPLPDMAFGYRAANAVCAAAGNFYLEGIGSSEDPRLMQAVASTLTPLIKSIPPSADILQALQRFPESMKAHEKAVLYLGNAFGYEGFQRTYAVPILEDGSAMTVFIVTAHKATDGPSAVAAYVEFLEENGARRLSPVHAEGDMVVLDHFGFVEVVFSHRGLVAGVHEAQEQKVAERAARHLWQHMKNLEADLSGKI
ncbi:MAG: DUF6599 family protein [Desulfosoma sp.]|uniref:DUF6599 family protein n=1 Tax=Desulfosoma sp. TaxID=2603217 RepID=UPI00404A01AC